jgi:hypothetical protein
MISARHRSTSGAAAGRPAAILLARPPVAGRVKTRLAADLGPAPTLELYRALLADTLDAIAPLARRGWRVRVEWSAPCRLRSRPSLRRRGVRSGLQARGGLGRRIEAALRRALRAGASCAIAIGADAPHLGRLPLLRAAALLKGAEVVLGPARDGGYYLIGARRVEGRWFSGIDWGSRRVLAQTVARLRRERVGVRLLRRGSDIDDLAQVRRLRRALRRSAALRRRLRATTPLLLGAGSLIPSRRET